MSTKDTRQNLRTIILVALVVIIVIVAAYTFMSNPPEVEEVLSVDEIMENEGYQEYLGTVIMVEGYYYHETSPEGQGVITSTIIQSGQSSIVTINRLPVNHSAVNISLADQIKYRFVGTLMTDPSIPVPIDAIILIADEITRV
jgi:uncharacterized secreted protein with C-terminal beta-propeller domain